MRKLFQDRYIVRLFILYLFGSFILYLLVIAFAFFFSFEETFLASRENKHDDPIFSLVEMVAVILVHIISKSSIF